MIISAAVIIEMNGKEITIPCHRHGDVYKILRDLGFVPRSFKTIKQGFIAREIDPEDEFNGIEWFLDREEAMIYAKKCGQVEETMDNVELFSEDLW